MTASTERDSPLADWSARFATASASAAHFSVGELAGVTQVNLRGDAGDAGFAAAVRGALGFDLPATANTWRGGLERAALWRGPGEWLLTAAAGTLMVADGFQLIEQAADIGIAAACAEGVGLMDRYTAITVEYMNTRKQFGVPIATFQALRHRIADVKMQLELGR